MGYDDKNKFIEKYKTIESELLEGKRNRYRHNACFENAHLFYDYLNSNEIGSKN